jgi:peptidoglycan/LPS O-acetylase OafA/YrhL
MWARISEILLGLWLFASYLIFKTGHWCDFANGALILIFALLSYKETLNKMHLLQIIPASWLLYLAYSYPTYTLPFGYQNYILVALTLLMFAVIPSRASDHPRPWRKFLQT